MRVHEAMSPPTGSIHAGDTVLHAAQMMRNLNVGCLLVCDDANELVGILTDRDITLHLADGGNPASDMISQLVSGQRLLTIPEDSDLDDALLTMMIGRVRRLPVLTGEHLVGIISAADLACEGIADAALDAATPR